MKVVFIGGALGLTLSRLYAPVHEALDYVERIDIAEHLDTARLTEACIDADVIHHCYWSSYMRCRPVLGALPAINIMSVHHIMPHMSPENFAIQMLEFQDEDTIGPVIVADYQRLCEFRRAGTAAKMIPYYIDRVQHPYRPHGRSGKLRVGILGADDRTMQLNRMTRKRYSEIREAAELADAVIVDGTRDDDLMSSHPFDNLDDFYDNIDVYVVGSYVDAGPLPALEAMCRGIPVIATPTGMMPMVMREGSTGYFTDGSVDDMVVQLRRIEADGPVSVAKDATNHIPTPEEWVVAHDNFYRSLVCE